MFMKNEIELRVLEGIQNNRKMWIGLMKAKDLLNENITADIYHEYNGGSTGYQRTTNMSRAQSFERFMEQDWMFSPTTILLNVREKSLMHFEENKLIISMDKKLWIVDGQHRVEGIRKLIMENIENKNFLEMDIPVIITNLDNKYEEAILFSIFNKTQVGIRYDLVEDVLNREVRNGNIPLQKLLNLYEKAGIRIFKEIDLRLDAVETTKKINGKNKNPWFEQIIMPNENRLSAKNKIIRMRSFTTSLEPLIKVMKNVPNVNTDILVEHLEIFWNSLRKIMPEAFAQPNEFVLQKSTGASVLHAVYFKLLTALTNTTEVPKEEIMVNGLTRLKIYIGNDINRNFLDSHYWSSKDGRAGTTGTSKKSFSILISEINRTIDEFVMAEQRR